MFPDLSDFQFNHTGAGIQYLVHITAIWILNVLRTYYVPRHFAKQYHYIVFNTFKLGSCLQTVCMDYIDYRLGILQTL